MPAGDVFGLDGFFLNKSNPVVVSTIGINSTAAGAGITVVSGVFDATVGIATLTLSTAAGLSTTPFYVGAKIAVSGVGNGYNGNFVVTGFAGTTTVSYATTGYVGSITTPLTGLTGTLALLVTNTQITNTTWSSAQTHGWFGGGQISLSGQIATVDRIDFSNDTGTANIRGSLSLAKQELAATGNSNYGWFGAGYSDSPINTNYSTIDRIDFSNDSATASVRGPLSSVRRRLAATGNSNYGWFGGGLAPSTTELVDRIDFSNDSSTASPRGPLSLARAYLAATGNSNYGWFGGGDPGPVATVDRIDFSNDSSTASPRGPLSLARAYLAATGNSNYGWFGGGIPGPGATVDRIDFSNDSATASSRGPLSLARYYLAATGNSNYGWFGGGFIPSFTAIVDRIDFSNDSVSASPRGPLSLARSNLSATSGQARSSSVRLQKGGNFGWFGGGFNPAGSPTTYSRVNRIDFSNDLAIASIRSPLTLDKYLLAATGNSNYGWFGNGFVPGQPFYTTVDRIDFSNDLATISVRGPLSAGRTYLSATGNSNYGWFGGGVNGPLLSRVDRINFSNDATTAPVRGNLVNKWAHGAAGNSNYGWFGGGFDNNPGTTVVATVSRIDFSNDSSTASVRGPLSQARRLLAATGNSNYGWFGGGFVPGYQATVDRMDFSNDSVQASPRGSLVSIRGWFAATGNSNYGWFGGGNTPTTVATVERINFSNDSVTASPRGPLSVARYGLAATSNSTR
jgi:hypothetical protein